MAEQDIPAMDYAEHERTYHTFIEASKVGAVAVFLVLVCILVLTDAATGLGIAAGVFWLVVGLIASTAGAFARSGGWIVPLVILLLAFAQLIYINA